MASQQRTDIIRQGHYVPPPPLPGKLRAEKGVGQVLFALLVSDRSRIRIQAVEGKQTTGKIVTRLPRVSQKLEGPSAMGNNGSQGEFPVESDMSESQRQFLVCPAACSELSGL